MFHHFVLLVFLNLVLALEFCLNVLTGVIASAIFIQDRGILQGKPFILSRHYCCPQGSIYSIGSPVYCKFMA
jgi:hypothetical protein